MKKSFLIYAVLVLTLAVFTGNTSAEVIETSGRNIDAYLDTHHTHRVNAPDIYVAENIDDNENWDLGAKFDAPNIIKMNDWSLGAEVSKDLVQTNMREGWGAYAKVTYSGSLLNFSK